MSISKCTSKIQQIASCKTLQNSRQVSAFFLFTFQSEFYSETTTRYSNFSELSDRSIHSTTSQTVKPPQNHPKIHHTNHESFRTSLIPANEHSDVSRANNETHPSVRFNAHVSRSRHVKIPPPKPPPKTTLSPFE